MRIFGLACTSILLLTSCSSPNDVFQPSTDGSSSTGGSSTTDPTTGTTAPPTTGDPNECPEPDPRGTDVAECELAAPPALNIANHPAFASTCDDTPLTLWARVNVDMPDIVELCDQDCGTCNSMSTIDLTDLRYQFLKLLGVIAGPGECMRVVHQGHPYAPDDCQTTRLAVWDIDNPAPRYVLGIDSIDPLPGTGISIVADAPYSCACSADDKTDPLYPCCATSDIQYFDLLVTPDDGCPFRARRGTVNIKRFETLGSTYDFLLFNAYEYEGACPEARDTYYWTMGRLGG